MIALAVDARKCTGGVRSGASFSVMIFSTKATGSLTFAHLCSVSVALAMKAEHHIALLNEENIVM
jgi:hypothetical protein